MGEFRERCSVCFACGNGPVLGFIGSSPQTLWFCEVRWTKALRGIEDAKSRTKWISDYRALPDRDIERGHEYLASLRCVMSYGNGDIID